MKQETIAQISWCLGGATSLTIQAQNWFAADQLDRARLSMKDARGELDKAIALITSPAEPTPKQKEGP